MTKDQRPEYDYRLKHAANKYAIRETAFEEGYEEGYEEGREEVRKEEEIEIIRRLLNMDEISVSQIAQVTSVDEAYVLSIKSQMDNNGK